MKKTFLLIFIFFGILCFINPAYSFSFRKKKEKPYIVLSSADLNNEENLKKATLNSVFKINERIYFYVYTPDGFKSDYIKYQIVKQDDNAHVQGFTRIRNITKRVKNKNKFVDYVVLSQKGKYFIQVFDIENLHQWIAIAGFLVVDD